MADIQTEKAIIKLYNDVMQYKTSNPMGSGTSEIYTLKAPTQSGTMSPVQSIGYYAATFTVNIVTDNPYVAILCFSYEAVINGVNLRNTPNNSLYIGQSSFEGGSDFNIGGLQTRVMLTYHGDSAPTFSLDLNCKCTAPGSISITRKAS